MACREDIRSAIYNTVFSELTDGRNTFSRIAEDTIQINNPIDNLNTKAKSTEQAHAIAKSLVSRVQESFLNQVRGEINQYSKYDPVTVRFSINPNYINHEYSKLDPSEQTDPNYNLEPSDSIVDYQLKAVNNLQSDRAKEIFNKGIKNNWTLNKVLDELGGFGDKTGYRNLFNEKQLNSNVKDLNREQLALDVATNYSYTVEINTATTSLVNDIRNGRLDPSMEDYIDPEELYSQNNTQYYSQLTVPGSTNYTENEIKTPGIVPSIKGHAQFATDNGIGWFRSDDKTSANIGGSKSVNIQDLHDGRFSIYDEENGVDQGIFNSREEAEIYLKNGDAKTRRILEIQSDLFQRGRKQPLLTNNKDLDSAMKEGTISGSDALEWTKELEKTNQNQFLQLLNKDNNWVTFFIKSIIQDSTKKGYEKVLFPSGETAAKVEGHQTLANEIKSINEEIEQRKSGFQTPKTAEIIENLEKRKQQLKTEGIEKLKPIESFYEKTVGNILNKQYKENVKRITDEYGNTWNELNLITLPKQQLFLDAKDEQDYVNANSGPNTYNFVNDKPIDDSNITVGYYTRYLQLKKKLLESNEGKLNRVTQKINGRNNDKEELAQLKKERKKLKDEIEGINIGSLKQEGLKDEILRIEKNAATLSVAHYVNKDLKRLDSLVNSNSIADLEDAKALIDFYELAGIFREDKENPFFEKSDIFFTDENGKSTGEYLLDQSTRDQFKKWADKATSYKQQQEDKVREVSIATVNSNPAVKRTYGDKQFTYNDITNAETGLQDADYLSMFTMDVTQGIFSRNGILPQVMYSELNSSIINHLKSAREIQEVTDELNPKVIKRLKELNQTLKSLGILEKNGVTYQIFKEKTKNGYDTGNFVTKFTPEYSNIESEVKNIFRNEIDNAKVTQDNESRNTAFKNAFKNLRNWRRNNQIIFDVSALPEIIDDPEFKEFSNQFNPLKAESHKKYLISVIGEKEYKRQIKEQKRLLRNYSIDRQGQVDSLLDTENVDEPSKLSNKAWDALDNWDKKNSPFYGVSDYSKVAFNNHIDNYSNYNVFVPRRNGVKINKDESGYNYIFEDTKTPTEYYNTNYEKYIENDDILGKFHDLLVAANEHIRENLPYEQQLKFAANSLPAIVKSSAEIVADRTDTTNILRNIFESFRHLWEQIRLSFGIIEQSENDYTTKNPITGKTEYKVNDSFITRNERAIRDRMTIEATRFLQAYNDGNNTLEKISKYTNLNLSKLNPSSLLLLAEYLHVPLSVDEARTGKINALKEVAGDKVSIGRIIRDFSVHTIVQAYSFDLAKLVKHGTYLASMYAARTEALPVLQLLRNDYESIKNPKLTNLSKQLFNIPDNKLLTEGERSRAKKQMEDYFDRVVLDNYGLRHTGEIGTVGKTSGFGRRIYSNEDKQKYKELTDLIDKEKDDKTRTNLLNMRDKLGRVRTTTAAFNNLLAWIRTMRLGYNLSSGVTNYIEGWASNMIIGATGEYFDPDAIYKAYAITRSASIKNITFGKVEPWSSKKMRVLMDKFKVVMDTANQLQESTEKTFSSKLEWLHPHAINERVEYNNQGALFLAMLLSSRKQDHTVTSKDGKVSSLWDAYDDTGNLKEEFRTEENIRNWEDLTGDGYKTFDEKLGKALVLAHGNYDEMRGMLAKSMIAGKVGFMFKTWLPQQLYWRFAVQQDDVQAGNIGFKGKYWSYGKGSGALHGAAVGSIAFGPLGAAVGGALGYFLGNQYGTDSGVGMLKETLISTRVLLNKMIGMPINTIAGRVLIKNNGELFDNWVGNKGRDGKIFTQQDANALKSNMADISFQLMCLALLLLVKKLFWNDNDKKDDPERLAHNLLINRLMNLSSQAGMYVNPSDVYKSTLGSNGVIQYLTDVGKEVDALSNTLQGRGTTVSGVNSGKSQLWSQTKKTLIPGIFKSIEDGGMGSQMQSQQQKSPYDYYFKSDANKEKSEISRNRAEMKLDIQDDFPLDDYVDDKEREKAIKKQLDSEMPTQAELKKMGLTKEQYQEQLDNQ